MSQQQAIGQLNANAAQSGVLAKLIAFSLALGALPLSSYYVSKQYLWPGNDIYAAVLAVVAANIVLVSYIIVAALEERKATPATKPEETKKEK
ncbi:hypothetical protein FA13DRAFT_1814818 [Coprinellus micaceus]|uniref:Uncharacterized protein n=1 Tax=Coprinellus micaceus TaxID=71717 RepID=A0A4Y7T7P0_COPMI|nr:hypothetical protein FA13DRAFT_1814818 [Coprinellus micaceus]